MGSNKTSSFLLKKQTEQLGVNKLERCNNCGVEMPEEDYYFNEGLCDKCKKKIAAKEKEFTSIPA